mgnify:FL=1
MRMVATAMLVMTMAAVSVFAGNPDARVYIDFDPPNYVHERLPALYSVVEAYICADQLSGGAMSISLRMEDPEQQCAGVVDLVAWEFLLPAPITPPPAPWDGPGTTLGSTECFGPGPVPLGKISLLYLGGECGLEILDHVDYPRWVVDCEDPPGVDDYCVLSNGSIGGADAAPGDCVTPVKSSRWGRIKALYR